MAGSFCVHCAWLRVPGPGPAGPAGPYTQCQPAANSVSNTLADWPGLMRRALFTCGGNQHHLSFLKRNILMAVY